MAVNFATPIAHQTTADFSVFNNAITVGRPYRQPLQTAPDPASFASGWELFLTSTGDAATIYAWLDGDLTWEAHTSSAPGNRLVLATDERSIKGRGSLAQLRRVEAPPARAFYENVDAAAVQKSLEALFNSAYLTAKGPASTWHPAMRLQIVEGNRATNLKVHLDRHAPAADEITILVTGFLSGGAAVLVHKIPVLAGETIGRAAAYLTDDPLPTAPAFPLGVPADADRARRLTFATYDRSGQVVNPSHYHHIYLNQMLLPAAKRRVVTLTNVVTGNTLAHPLVTLFPALANTAPPSAREQVDGQSRFPIGDLTNFHGYPADAPASRLEWRYLDTGELETRARIAGSTVPPLAPGKTQTTRVSTLWTTYGTALSNICRELQVPCEVVIGLVGAEAPAGLDERAVRFEPLRTLDRERLRNASVAAADELAYDKVVGLRGTATAALSNADGTTRLEVTLAANRTWSENFLSRNKNWLLADDVDRLKVQANTGGVKTSSYQITVTDRKIEGGFAASGNQGAGLTRFHDPGRTAAGATTAAGAQMTLARGGVVRMLRLVAGENTLNGPSTVTVMSNGTATALTVTLVAGSRVGDDLMHSFSAAAGAALSLRVVTTGTAGSLANLSWSLLHAPAAAPAGGTPPGDIWVLEGFSTSVPSPWNDAAFVRPGRTLTWAQILPIVEATRGNRVSPGLLQTLVSTAREVADWLNEAAPGLFTALGIPPPPAALSDYLNEWLCRGVHSLLMGAATMRIKYNSKATGFDLPLVGAAYNAGSLFRVANSNWGLRYHGDYVEHAGPHLNAAAALFNGPAPTTVPSVRLMR